MCKISRATTFIKLKKYVKNADFELHIENRETTKNQTRPDLQKVKLKLNHQLQNSKN